PVMRSPTSLFYQHPLAQWRSFLILAHVWGHSFPAKGELRVMHAIAHFLPCKYPPSGSARSAFQAQIQVHTFV
ncbi:TPA: hypothetical protein ACKQCG_004982, partial [Pseudomonas aeruginosa]